nr:rab9 effector protein with kelch motifs-like [Lytechinus pictus]
MELHPILERGEWLCKHNLWYVVSARGQHPSMRVGQCCCHIPSTQRWYWEACCVTSEWKNHPPSSGKIPSARHGHVMAVCNGKIYLHGGMSGTSLFDDVYEYSIDTGVWKIVKSKGDIPSGRAAHGCVSHGNKILIFGGMTTGGASDETYMFDTRKSRWLKLKPDGPPPAPRLDHAMCLVTLPCPAQITQSTSNRQNGAEGAAASASRAPCAGDPSSAAEEFLTSCVETAVEQMSGESPREGSRGGAGAASSTVSGEATLCCLVQGGMDTQGEIFDDCLLLRLDNLL